MSQQDKAEQFKALHVPGTPVVLYNIWDAAGAKTLTKAGAQAIATGSWSMAAAHGYKDGEVIPLDLVLQLVERIVHSTDLPVSVDLEGGYGDTLDAVAQNIQRLLATGAIGVNIEDRMIAGTGLRDIDDQTARLSAIRAVARAADVPLFINARTDLFLGTDPDTHANALPEALARAQAYADAGADGFFVPGLTDPKLIRGVVDSTPLPVNVMMMGDMKIADMAALGVARVSYGPAPFASAQRDLRDRFQAISE